MKKILFSIALIFCLAFGTMAQEDFFGSYEKEGNTRGLPDLPGGGETGDQPAPLSSGLLILTSLGVGYFVGKKKFNS